MKASDRALVAFAAIFVVLVALACKKKATSSSTSTTTSAVATASASAAPAPTAKVAVPDPAADYTKMDDLKMDGNAAFGKTALFRVWRGTTEPDKVTLYPCGDKSGGINWLVASFTSEQKPLVKAIPSTAFGTSSCPRVFMKVTGKEKFSNTIKAEITDIFDVEPEADKPLPAGVDFVSMDDVNFAGKSAAGKIAQFTVYRGDTKDTEFTAYPCERSGGINFVKIKYTTAQKEAVKDLPTRLKSCKTAKIKLTTRDFGWWKAELIDITD